jgi:2'-5' RNA ligase
MLKQTQRVVLAALGFAAAILAAMNGGGAQTSPVTAIDIALEPDQAVEDRAHNANNALMAAFPNGYALDATHRAHVTLLQRYVRTADLDKVYAAANGVMAKEDVAHWKLKADKYFSISTSGIAALIMHVQQTPDLLRLQRELIDAETPFTVETGTTAAFFTTPEEPDIIPWLVDYVATYVPKASGANFTPHVTVGVATEPFAQKLVAEPFDPIIFSPVEASVYQLGNYGTARKKLNVLPVAP